jgi:hypothetical protein
MVYSASTDPELAPGDIGIEREKPRPGPIEAPIRS